MGKFNDKLQRFFYGRNGNDKLNNFIFFLYFVSFIVYLFVRHYIVLIISTLIFIISIDLCNKKKNL
jgi:energy-coupling factor transporter transmembrane protein EcfT